jgi:hypothetical protein
MGLFNRIQSHIIAAIGVVTFALASLTSIAVENKTSSNQETVTANNIELLNTEVHKPIQAKPPIKISKGDNNKLQIQISKSYIKNQEVKQQQNVKTESVRYFKTILPLDKIPKVNVGVGEAANAEWYSIGKDVYNSIADHTVRNAFNQTFMFAYDAQSFKKEYGEQGKSKAYERCYTYISNTRKRWVQSPFSAVIREEDGKFNCYERTWGEK